MTDPDPGTLDVVEHAPSPDSHTPPEHAYTVAQSHGREERIRVGGDFSLFYRRHYPGLVRFLTSHASEPAWAEDAAQETMMAVSANWDHARTQDRPQSWLFNIALRRLRQLEMSVRDRSMLHDGLHSDEIDRRLPAAVSERIEDRLDLITGLQSVPRRQRDVLGLHYFGGYTLAQTAQILGMEEGTAKSHLNRGLRKLRARVASLPRSVPLSW